MEQSRLQEYAQALTSKGVVAPCPRCTHSKFSIIGESFISIKENPNVIAIGGPSIPTVIVACDNCGYITQHAQVPLGMAKGGKL